MRKKIITKLVNRADNGFTLVELVAVVVFIAILSGISLVAYNSWEKTTITAQLKSDLNGASSAMENARTFGNSYPKTIPTTFKTSSGVSLVVKANDDGSGYCIDATSSRDSTVKLYIDSYLKGAGARQGVCAARGICPAGFIIVGGSVTYGTSDFCVMKYEAKNAGGNVPISEPDGSPWANINQANATAYAPNVAGCSNCHLITEAEWMTIAQSVLKNPKNWDDGAGNHNINTGYVYSGHSDNNPSSAVYSNANDNDLNTNGYEGTNNTLISGNDQRRTFYLMNGEIIWDMSGNVKEWTAAQISSGQPGVDGSGLNWHNWSDITNPGSLAIDISPLGTGVTENAFADAASGIGGIYSDSEDTSLEGVIRGGCWAGTCHDGILSVKFVDTSSTADDIGFRVAAPLSY